MEECIFCRIVTGKLPSEIVYKDGEIVAFRDIRKEAPVHVLVVPVRHIPSLKSLKKDETEILGRLQGTISQIAEELGIGGAYKVNLNAGSFQEVPHVHYHLKGGWGKGG